MAPAGPVTVPFRPTCAKRSFCTTNAEFSMGARPSPVMSVAPSYTTGPPVRVWPCTRQDDPAARSRHAATANSADVPFTPRTSGLLLFRGYSILSPTLLRTHMTMRTLVLAAALLTVLPGGSALHAQEPVVGVKDPESLFKDPVQALNRNKQAALHIMRELLQCGQWDRAGEW